MHYTGTIWRPPYEGSSLLLEVTAGCTHRACKFCTLYEDLPFGFRMTPLETIEADLREAQMLVNDPMKKLAARLQGLPDPESVSRVFLVGANPFVLHFNRLKAIAELIHAYIPSCKTIGCFARVTDVAAKTGGELQELRRLGYDGISIGVESGDGDALAFMDKGYSPEDIVEQAGRLDEAGISYCFMYLAGLSGAGKCVEGAQRSAGIFNQTRPKIIGTSMLTIFPESQLYQEIQAGRWQEAGEVEKLCELKALVELLDIPVYFATLGASNAVWVQGMLPQDREKLLAALDNACQQQNEAELRRYRTSLPHL